MTNKHMYKHMLHTFPNDYIERLATNSDLTIMHDTVSHQHQTMTGILTHQHYTNSVPGLPLCTLQNWKH